VSQMMSNKSCHKWNKGPVHGCQITHEWHVVLQMMSNTSCYKQEVSLDAGRKS
jgi:hypothetical protein